MPHTNSFKTNKEYYERLFGRRNTPKKNPNAKTVIDNASQSFKPDLESDLTYSLIPSNGPANTYGLALEKLTESVDGINSRHLTLEYIRPLTFKETIEARLNAYKTGMTEDEKKFLLFCCWLSTCTGIAYPASNSANPNKFKIIPICEELINLDYKFKESFLKTHYNSLQGEELDRSQGISEALLTKKQAKAHPVWLAAVEGDRTLLSEYANLVFSLFKGKNMRFIIADIAHIGNTPQLIPLDICYINNNSNASGFNNFDYISCFIRIANNPYNPNK